MSKAEQLLCMGCMLPLESGQQCLKCGWREGSAYDPHFLKPGTRLGTRYLVGQLAKKNGEGALYIGYDLTAQETVWVREYAPMGIARRDLKTGELLPADGHGAQYKAQLSDFEDICNEVKRLSVTERVVPIEAVVRQNNTIYAIYRFIKLIPLERYIAGCGGKLPCEEALALLYPLYNILTALHKDGHIHRGVSPYTVYMGEDGNLYLWNFSLSAARTAGCELETELFNGFSAPEQYSPNGWQGTWTDVYGVAALLYWMISGVVPPKSTLISASRPLALLEDLVMSVPRTVSNAIAAAMQTSPSDRTQSVAAFSAALTLQSLSSTAVYDTSKIAANRRVQPKPANNTPPARGRKKRSSGGFKYILLALFFTIAVLFGVISLLMATFFPDLLGGRDSQSRPSSQPPSSQTESSSSSQSQSVPAQTNGVPLFVGRNIDVVRDNREYQQRFEFSVRLEYNDTVDEGIIFNQSPAEGVPMPNRGTVILYVSKGPSLTVMPDVVGLPLQEAADILTTFGFPFEKIEQYNSSLPPNTVIRTSPPEGIEIDLKIITIYVFVTPPEEETGEEPESSPPVPDVPSSGSSSSSSRIPSIFDNLR